MQQSETKLESWFEPQLLQQEGKMDCGVCVFGALTKLTRDEILRDMPDAANGKTLEQWQAYVNGKGWEMVRHQPGEEYALPCAHLHQVFPGFYHWIYQAEDGGIHDPDPSWQLYPPKMMKLSFYRVILTVTVNRKSRRAE